jgi:hypothetical protein
LFLIQEVEKQSKILLAVGLSLFTSTIYSQVKITGKVYDSTGVFPMEAVSVLGGQGRGTVTDQKGYYEITLDRSDSIWFCYLGKPTRKFPVAEIELEMGFNISLRTGIPVLKEVTLQPANYKLDSIRNRADYAKGFNYKKPTFSSIVTSISITGITVDLDELIKAFGKKKIKRSLSFRERLIEQEHDKFIDHRFTALLVRTLTGLEGTELRWFMDTCRPDYSFVSIASDYELRKYIKDCYLVFCNRN